MLGEHHTILCKAVNIWSPDAIVAIAANVTNAKIVRHQKKDVWTCTR